MRTAVYVSVWAAVIAFVCGEALRGGGNDARRRTDAIAWCLFSGGLLLAVVHSILAFGIVHRWSHDAAVRHTAAQTAAVYGLPFGDGIYVNYLFFGAWFADAWWWRTHPGQRMRPSIEWTLRTFYLIVLVNATVIFAAGWRRWLGIGLVAVLVTAWGRQRPVRT